MILHRRTGIMRGMVNFPINDERFKNTGEGGMFVRLVVDNINEYGGEFMVCCGGNNHVFYDESFIGTDYFPEGYDRPNFNSDEISRREFPRLDKEVRVLEYFWKDKLFELEKYMSVPYLVVMTIGSTGWSGYYEKKEQYWRASYADLTDEGKRLYNSIAEAYDGYPIHLQTWLDT